MEISSNGLFLFLNVLLFSKKSEETTNYFIMLLWIFISMWHDLVPRDIPLGVQQLVEELQHSMFSYQQEILQEAGMMAYNQVRFLRTD